MTTPIKLFAIEIETSTGRAFYLTDYALDSGFVYKGIQLFESDEAAQADVNENIEFARQSALENAEDDDECDEDDFDDEGGSVTPVLLHQDGNIFDTFGADLAKHISDQSGLTVAEVTQHVAEYYKDNSRRLRKEAQSSNDGPGM